MALKITDSIQKLWRRKEMGIAAEAAGSAKRKTLALPSILTPYRASAQSLPKPTPVNLRRFAETPLVRRAINLLKDRIASMDWQVRLKRGFSAAEISDAQARMQILRQVLEEPNPSDSFRTLVEQVLEDALVGGFGAIEMELTGNPEKPFELWAVDGATIQINPKWDGQPDSVRYAQTTGLSSTSSQIFLR